MSAAPIHHGEAVEWPAGLGHAAWTDGSTMRALLVEVPDVALESRHERLARAARVEVDPIRRSARPGCAGRAGRREVASRGPRRRTEGEPW